MCHIRRDSKTAHPDSQETTFLADICLAQRLGLAGRKIATTAIANQPENDYFGTRHLDCHSKAALGRIGTQKCPKTAPNRRTG